MTKKPQIADRPRTFRALLVLPCLLALSGSVQAAPPALAGTRIDWSRWERTISDSAKARALARLDSQALEMAEFAARHASHRLGRVDLLNLVHATDFSGDGIDDIVVEGQAGESTAALLYQHIGGDCVPVFSAAGVLVDMHRRAA